MTSAEPTRTRAYSSDIGWRVVWFRIRLGIKFYDIAARLNIGVGTAHRIFAKFVATGDVSLLPQGM
jgi:CRP-like cAMP-binding protein